MQLNIKETKENTCGQMMPNLRRPDIVMNLDRLGSLFPQKYSFMRILIRNLSRKNPNFKIQKNSLNQRGYGHIVLSINLGINTYSLICYTQHLNPEDRSDRVIATKWDASFCLYLGIPTDSQIENLRSQVTIQENGRFNNNVLALSRANKSITLFNHILNCLSNGKQPSKNMISKTSYLMRTTAVYGNGKFGIADRELISDVKELIPPFQVEMLTVFLIREFSFIYIENCAKKKGGIKAAKLDYGLKKYLGIGNSTGLGMAPFLVNHPCLLHSWIMAKEISLARVINLQSINFIEKKFFFRLLNRAYKHINEWNVADNIQMKKIYTLRSEIKKMIKEMSSNQLPSSYPFKYVYEKTHNLSTETQELIASILIEFSPEDLDGLEECLANPNEPKIIPSMTIKELINIINEHYDWVFKLNLNEKKSNAFFWYTSQEKLEPRLGKRFEENGSELEMPFNIPHFVTRLAKILDKYPVKNETIADFLLKKPCYRFIIRRIQNTAKYPYSEIRNNLIDESCRPVDMLRCKLSFFGASKFDPKSDRWTRITLFQGAPLASDMGASHNNYDDWIFSTVPN